MDSYGNYEVTDDQKTLLIVVGTMDRLIDAGLLGGSKLLTEDGVIKYNKLREQNVCPDHDEIKSALACFATGDDLEDMVILVQGYLDGRINDKGEVVE